MKALFTCLHVTFFSSWMLFNFLYAATSFSFIISSLPTLHYLIVDTILSLYPQVNKRNTSNSDEVLQYAFITIACLILILVTSTSTLMLVIVLLSVCLCRKRCRSTKSVMQCHTSQQTLLFTHSELRRQH